MKMIKVEFSLNIGYANADRHEIVDIEVGDDVTDEDLEELLNEEWQMWSTNYIDGGFKVL
jgi:hypothetical protein